MWNRKSVFVLHWESVGFWVGWKQQISAHSQWCVVVLFLFNSLFKLQHSGQIQQMTNWYFYFIFWRKQGLHFMQIWKQFAWKVKLCFLQEIKKKNNKMQNKSKCHLLLFLSRMLSVKMYNCVLLLLYYFNRLLMSGPVMYLSFSDCSVSEKSPRIIK